ncbi:MAG: hypothetical protein OHK0017_10980 [Patescibacteria group bacterium]
MFCLFLDTEVTGLTPEYEILEVGAVLTKVNGNELKIVSRFQSLIKPQNGIPDNIQRLTGLKPDDFKDAQSESEIRLKWDKWLQSEIVDLTQDIVVVGHSIAFDLSFLQVHRFWLPEVKPNLATTLSKGYGRTVSVPACDTLELAKIFLPEENTLNLEYLTESLKLKDRIDLIISQLNREEWEPVVLSSHRALYDTCGAIALFQYIFERIQQLNLPTSLLSFLQERKLIPFYPKNTLELPLHTGLNLNILDFKNQIDQTQENQQEESDLFSSSQNSKVSTIQLNLNGQISNHDPVQKLIQCDWTNLDLESLILDQYIPVEIRLILCQIYVWITTTRLNIRPYKIHVYGLLDKHNLSSAIEFLNYLDNKNPDHIQEQNLQYIIPEFERLILNINSITEEEFDLTNFTQYFDLYVQTWENKIGQKFELKLNNDLDFLAARFENYFQNTQKKEIWIYPTTFDHELQDLGNQFRSIASQFNQFQDFSQKGRGLNSFLDFLEREVQTKIENFQKLEWFNNPFLIRHSKYGLKLSRVNRSFNWEDYWNSLSLIPNLSLGTYLDQTNWQKMGDLINMPDEIYEYHNSLVTLFRKDIEQQYKDNGLEESLDELIAELDPNAVTLILTGQNASLERTKEYLVKKLNHNQFLALGETGSLTKIIGKLKQGFKGVAVIKSSDIGFIRQLSKVKINPTALVVQPPYMIINQFWKQSLGGSGGDFTEQVIKPLRSIYLNSIIGQLSTIGVQKVNYLAEIKPVETVNSDPLLY